jgi:hypothetical protein
VFIGYNKYIILKMKHNSCYICDSIIAWVINIVETNKLYKILIQSTDVVMIFFKIDQSFVILHILNNNLLMDTLI